MNNIKLIFAVYKFDESPKFSLISERRVEKYEWLAEMLISCQINFDSGRASLKNHTSYACIVYIISSKNVCLLKNWFTEKKIRILRVITSVPVPLRRGQTNKQRVVSKLKIGQIICFQRTEQRRWTVVFFGLIALKLSSSLS